jgi:hypothetical protein
MAILGSWQKIARHLGKSIRTVQRWEGEFGLPVRRPGNLNSKIVMADTAEIDAWIHAMPTRAEIHSPKKSKSGAASSGR